MEWKHSRLKPFNAMVAVDWLVARWVTLESQVAWEISYVPVRKVAKATVVNGDPLASIDHFDVI